MSIIRVLFIGDIVGDPALSLLEELLPQIKNDHQVTYCVANGENAYAGRGISEAQAKRLFDAGVNVLTGGDHSFDRSHDYAYMRKEPRLLRPLNYPKGVPGNGMGVYEVAPGILLGFLNLRGLSFFQNPIDCPFRMADWAIGRLREETNLILVDFHAEASAEKKAMGWYLDGRVSAILGTHTHVQTADEEILPQGTGYITDVGFTGPHQSVIGMDIQQALNRITLQIPQKYIMAEKGYRINAVLIDLDTESGFCVKINRVCSKLGFAAS
jgi:metallophosphoesterase (TIGR00282 family)